MKPSLALQIMDLAILFSIPPALVVAWRWKRLNRTQCWLAALVVFSMVTELSAYTLSAYFHVTNLPLLHLFTVVEFTLLTLVFRSLGAVARRWSGLLIVGFAVLAVVSARWWFSLWEMNVVPRSLESLLVSGYALRYFSQRLRAVGSAGEAVSLKRRPGFWVSTAVILYFPASLFIFLYGSWFVHPVPLSLTIYAAHALLSICKSLLFTVALWTILPTEAYPTSSY